ncbi:MAG: sodium:solute symporter [Bacteroidota bacterium]
MKPLTIVIIIGAYFSLLILISLISGRKADSSAFFLGNRKSPWYIVAFGMIGASLSGVTFISVPGWVADSQFTYMQMILGYLAGYAVIANILMPVYYRLQLTSIYGYLEGRFGRNAYKTGASFFLLSRVIGSSFRLYLVARVLQLTVFDAWGVPFWLTVVVTIALIWLYTFRGGIKTIIWTDTLQTAAMLLAVVLSVIMISREMGLSSSQLFHTIRESHLSRVFVFDDWNKANHFIKYFFSGAFITIVMTGLDQDMMQKNLSCRNIREAKKNMYWMSAALVPVNLLFLSLGAILVIFAGRSGIAIPASTDDLFPLIATGGYLPPVIGILFIIGLVAAAYSSADSALTALTTSFTVDILDAGRLGEERLNRTRKLVHVGISLVLVLVILIFRLINDESVISAIFRIAGYTYGPLLGIYAYGLFTKRKAADRLIPVVAVLSPVLTYLFNRGVTLIWADYKFGFELLIINGAITFAGLLLISGKRFVK